VCVVPAGAGSSRWSEAPWGPSAAGARLSALDNDTNVSPDNSTAAVRFFMSAFPS
jgi:hypothetical protein